MTPRDARRTKSRAKRALCGGRCREDLRPPHTRMKAPGVKGRHVACRSGQLGCRGSDGQRLTTLCRARPGLREPTATSVRLSKCGTGARGPVTGETLRLLRMSSNRWRGLKGNRQGGRQSPRGLWRIHVRAKGLIWRRPWGRSLPGVSATPLRGPRPPPRPSPCAVSPPVLSPPPELSPPQPYPGALRPYPRPPPPPPPTQPATISRSPPAAPPAATRGPPRKARAWCGRTTAPSAGSAPAPWATPAAGRSSSSAGTCR
mmetsp:Transcript_108851/g.304747  ORF Transcript_108851/g.304747 Transcript_108851/m.304747 type:complete len:259 (-) Transcript_108851:894-1670(-)